MKTIQRTPLSILTYELMPNHWHFVVKPDAKEQLSTFFQYLAGTHAKRFRAFRNTAGEGHVYQDRFRSFPVESDGHLLALCRYVERNAKRSGLVERAEDWRWGGLWRRLRGCDDWLIPDWPVPRPEDWIERVNAPLTRTELVAVRQSIRRGSPYGNPEWIVRTSEMLSLGHTLRSAGRPAVAAT